MNKVKFHYGYPINVDIDTDKQVDVYIDTIETSPIPERGIRIMILEEPKKDRAYEFVRSNTHLYTHLLTFHEDLLQTNPKAIKFHMMTGWVRHYVSKHKEFSVSTVVGGKNDSAMEGYALRHHLWKSRSKIRIPRKFYLSGNAKHFHNFKPWKEVSYVNELVLGASKEPLFDSMFHIAIENTSIKNYFSEKLVDCFQGYSVPIYYGCTNVEEYFNPAGMFRVNNVNEIIRVCNQLTPEIYYRMKPMMEDNYNGSLKWLDSQEQIKNGILQILEK